MKTTFSLLFLTLFSLPLLRAQVSQQTFGKNRVQYHQKYSDWSQYDSRNFTTYWYGEGRFIGQTVVMLAEQDFAEIQSLLEHRMNSKIEIIVYTDLTDLKQSNIGSEEAFQNTGGQTKIVGNKMFVYFTGDHNELHRQIREGIAEVYMNAMLFGSNLQEIVQNAVMLNLPEWFKRGLVSYVGRQWDTDIDAKLRRAMTSEAYEGFEKLAEEQPELAGHALWYYIAQTHGHQIVGNLLYLTRIQRNMETGFLYVLGSTYEQTIENWETFFLRRYQDEVANTAAPEGTAVPIRNKRDLPLTELKLSPDGQRIAYALNEIGKTKVYVQDLRADGTRRMVLKNGSRNAIQATDYNYPLLAWSPSGYELVIIYERRDVIYLKKLDLNSGESTTDPLDPQFQRIYSAQFTDNNNELILSAAVRGNVDIYRYSMNTRSPAPITRDFWDDLDPVLVRLRGKPGVLFSSNRPDSLLEAARLDSIVPVGDFDLFWYDLEEGGNELVQITDTDLANERMPQTIDTTWYVYTSDASGVRNRYAGYLEDYIHHYDKIAVMNDGTEIRFHPDSALTTKLDSAALANIDTVAVVPVIKTRGINHAQTNYPTNIDRWDLAMRSDRAVEVFERGANYLVQVKEIRPETRAQPYETHHRRRGLPAKTTPEDDRLSQRRPARPRNPLMPDGSPRPVPAPEPETPPDPVPAPQEPASDSAVIDLDNYLFQSEFDDVDVAPRPQEETRRPEPLQRDDIRSPRQQRTRLSLPILSDVLRRKPEKFRPGGITPYRITFRTDYLTTNIDNEPLFDGLNSFAGTPQDYTYPPPGILLKGNFKDLFEDYQLEGGVRIPVNFNGAEYFVFLDDRKKRLDKRYAFYRRSLNFAPPVQSINRIDRQKNIVMLGQYQLRYPLDLFTSIRGTFTLRGDKTIQQATDVGTLFTPSLFAQRAGIKGEYVFDNTLDVALNIKNGTRYKVYGEVMKRFNVDVVDGLDVSFDEGFLFVLGLDARHYQRFLKHSVLAARLAGATSFGSERILYFLGGTDNWLFQNFNNDIPITGDDFAFQTVASNLRGFRFNIRNGNSFALLNTEARIPVFKYINPRIRNGFLRNFQAVGFFDMGTAWQGPNPFDTDSPLNTVTVQGSQVEVRVNYFRDPIVMGYGFGVRSTLFGYFIRADYAWGIETRVVQEPRLYISLGLDF